MSTRGFLMFLLLLLALVLVLTWLSVGLSYLR